MHRRSCGRNTAAPVKERRKGGGEEGEEEGRREGGKEGEEEGRRGGREGERGRIILELIEAAAEYQCSDECSHLRKMSRLRGSGVVAKGER